MNWTEIEYDNIKHLLAKQRGSVVIDNLTLLQALAYMNKNGGGWRELPTDFGNWDTVYQRFRRWTKKGVLEAY
ncbi:MAG: transposase [Planctomycetaceae bacterium]|jgi:transposase|nr:transposase [Planctomycetaceae bacterium]